MLPRITLAAVFYLSAASAADLKPETTGAWDDYIHDANLHMQERLQPDHSFLWSDENPGVAARLRRGEIVVAPAGPHIPRHAPAGLIHHWIGAAFVPDTRMDEFLPVLRDYGRYKEFYRPHVLESKTVLQDGSLDRFSMVLMNKAVVLKTAIEGDYESRFYRVDPKRCYSVSETTRVQEIENYGTPTERKLASGHGSGYIWKIASIARFQERDGGVYVEVEALALSRDIPGAVRWVVEPMVRRVSRSSVATTLRQTQEAVGTQVTASGQAAAAPAPRFLRTP